MRLASLLTTVVGLAVAGGSAYLASQHFQQQQASAVASSEAAVVPVVVAGLDIQLGQAIEPHMLTTISWPRNAVPPGVFNDYTALLPANGQEPRRAKRAISQGELILNSKVSNFGEKVTIVQTLAPNNRAMAISVTAETAVGGFVTPGDYVDILLTQGGGGGLRTVTILQNIRVIGVDQNANEQNDMASIARTVTVEVSPEQGQKLALAQQAGRLSLTLRNLDDKQADTPLESIKLSDVLQELSPVPDGEKSQTIVVRRGTEISEEETKR